MANLGDPGALLRLALAIPVVLWLNVGTATAITDQVPTLFFALAFGLWMVSAALTHQRFLGDFIQLSWPITTILVIVAIASIGSSDEGLSAYIYGFAYGLLALALTAFYRHDLFRKERLVLLLVIGADLIVVGVRTASRLIVDPDVARYMATTEENRTEVYGDQSFVGLGGYGYTYAITAILIAAVVLALNARGRRRVGLALVSVALIAYIVLTGFTLAILLGALFGAVVMVGHIIRKVDGRLFLPALVVVTAIGLYIGPTLLARLANSDLFSAAVRMRLLELSSFLQGDLEQTLDLSTRVHFYGTSVEAFFSSPMVGSLLQVSPTATLGLHSSWLDLLGLLGILSILVLIMFRLTYKSLSWHTDRLRNTSLRAAWVYFAVLGLVNTLLFANIFLVWFFFLPQLLIHASNTAAESEDMPAFPMNGTAR